MLCVYDHNKRVPMKIQNCHTQTHTHTSKHVCMVLEVPSSQFTNNSRYNTEACEYKQSHDACLQAEAPNHLNLIYFPLLHE